MSRPGDDPAFLRWHDDPTEAILTEKGETNDAQ